MSRFFRHRGLKLIEVSISMVSAIRLSFTAKLIMEKMKIIDETNLMNFELLAKVLAAVEKWLGSLSNLVF